VLIERWRREYNVFRPHRSLGYRPPAPATITPSPLSLASLHPSATALGLTYKEWYNYRGRVSFSSLFGAWY
jgi:hypothetical protein